MQNLQDLSTDNRRLLMGDAFTLFLITEFQLDQATKRIAELEGQVQSLKPQPETDEVEGQTAGEGDTTTVALPAKGARSAVIDAVASDMLKEKNGARPIG